MTLKTEYNDPMSFIIKVTDGLKSGSRLRQTVQKYIDPGLFGDAEYVNAVQSVVSEIPAKPLKSILKNLNAAYKLATKDRDLEKDYN